jgi:hypothetical protein
MGNLEHIPPGLNRVAGTSPKKEEYLKTQISHQILCEQEIKDFERPMTEEERYTLIEILSQCPEFIEEYGSDKYKFISREQVHVLNSENPNSDKVRNYIEEKIGGSYDLSSGRLEILPITRNKDLQILHFAHILVHELMHAQSFSSFSYSTSKSGPQFRRIGFSMADYDDMGTFLFKFFDEAIIEELTRRFCEAYFPKMIMLKKAYSRRE